MIRGASYFDEGCRNGGDKGHDAELQDNPAEFREQISGGGGGGSTSTPPRHQSARARTHTNKNIDTCERRVPEGLDELHGSHVTTLGGGEGSSSPARDFRESSTGDEDVGREGWSTYRVVHVPAPHEGARGRRAHRQEEHQHVHLNS